jgi:hypothetical protein
VAGQREALELPVVDACCPADALPLSSPGPRVLEHEAKIKAMA